MSTLFLIGGMWAGRDSFKNFKSYFSKKGFNCVCPVFRYHDIDPDEKPNPDLGNTSILDYVDDLEIEYNKIDDSIYVLGHSMGGLLAQLLACRVKPKGVILLSSAPPLGINALTIPVIKIYSKVLLKPFFWKKPYKIPFNNAKYGIFNNLTANKQIDEYNKLVYESGKAILEIGLPMFDKKKASSVKETRITSPILIYHGLKDRIVPYTTGIKLNKKYYSSSTLKLLNNNAHLIEVEEGWEKVAEDIFNWISKLEV